jgi:hypothetical protein
MKNYLNLPTRVISLAVTNTILNQINCYYVLSYGRLLETRTLYRILGVRALFNLNYSWYISGDELFKLINTCYVSGD